MIRTERNGVVWYEFEQLQGFDNVTHGVISRRGVCECDDPLNVDVHKRAAKLAFGHEHLVMGKQCHGDYVARVDEKAKGLARIEACDGLMTDQVGINLLARHADCQAVLFYDPALHVAANVHCGWRGSVKEILPKTVQRLKQYGCKPEDLLVCISPSLGPTRAEFRHYKNELPESFYPFQVTPTYFNFWEISRFQLRSVGVLDEHIECAELCTYLHPGDYYSYRRDGLSGRNVTSICLG